MLPAHMMSGLMTSAAAPVLFALFAWWFSTGIIIYLDGLPRHTYRWSMLGATIVLGVSLCGLYGTRNDTSTAGAYAAFTYGLLVWGWLEMSFYTGYVTGPRKTVCAEGCAGWRHFGHAVMVSLYHEIAIIVLGLLVRALTWGAPNQGSVWIFLVLCWMHQSARLNVFLGVANISEEFLPEHLRFLRSFIRRRPMNLLFPVSITVSTVIAALLVSNAAAAGASAFTTTSLSFVATMMVLAIAEHWFLVVPLPVAALWAWILRSRGMLPACDVEIVAGFLGAGKTTFLRRRIEAITPGDRTVVLVNDFGSVGVDASLLRGRGAELVELANGCICCSLRRDVAVQLAEITKRWSPRQILIEPSGVADLDPLLSLLGEPEVRPLVKRIAVTAVVDAGVFLRDYARMEGYFHTQARRATLLVVNKTDVATPADLATIADTLRALNPVAPILATSFGHAEGVAPAQAAVWVQPRARNAIARPHSHAADLDLTAWTASLGGPCDPQSLRDLLEAAARGAFGQLERVKGISRAGSGWIHFDMAGGRASLAAFAPHEGEEPRVVAIGRRVDRDRLQAAFAACMAMVPV
jgi:putative photosynthetic complex assembly protein 2